MTAEYDFNCHPTASWLTVNRACNLRCKWCYGENSHFEVGKTMSFEEAKELVLIAQSMGADYFNIIGGEPTLWPHLLPFNDFCRELGVKTCLITNAVRFSTDTYWKEYKKHPCDDISISVKCADPLQFEKITGAALYTQTMKGIERAINFHHEGVSSVYNSLVGMKGLLDIAVACRELGANSFTVDLCNPVVGDDGITSGYSIEPQQLADDVVAMQPFISDLYDGAVEFSLYLPLCLFPVTFVEKLIETHQVGTICHVYSRRGMNFDTNGDVIPCNALLDSVIARKGEDYHDGPSLLAHLNSDELREDYRQLLRLPSNECIGCRWNKICRGGCLLNWCVFDPSICHAVK